MRRKRVGSEEQVKSHELYQRGAAAAPTKRQRSEGQLYRGMQGRSDEEK